MRIYTIIILFFFNFNYFNAFAQATEVNKTLINKNDSIKKYKPLFDTAPKIKHNHKIATKRSALIPGWGQAYNKEYWKIPIVYGALSIPVVTFFYNNAWYGRTRTAYDLLFKATNPGATLTDTLNLKNIHPKLQGFSLGSLQTFRSGFRQDRDYSVLWFLVVWGLNVVDATVFGHLKTFDVSDDLSMQINPTINPINNSKGLSVSLSLKQHSKKLLVIP